MDPQKHADFMGKVAKALDDAEIAHLLSIHAATVESVGIFGLDIPVIAWAWPTVDNLVDALAAAGFVAAATGGVSGEVPQIFSKMDLELTLYPQRNGKTHVGIRFPATPQPPARTRTRLRSPVFAGGEG